MFQWHFSASSRLAAWSHRLESDKLFMLITKFQNQIWFTRVGVDAWGFSDIISASKLIQVDFNVNFLCSLEKSVKANLREQGKVCQRHVKCRKISSPRRNMREIYSQHKPTFIIFMFFLMFTFNLQHHVAAQISSNFPSRSIHNFNWHSTCLLWTFLHSFKGKFSTARYLHAAPDCVP